MATCLILQVVWTREEGQPRFLVVLPDGKTAKETGLTIKDGERLFKTKSHMSKMACLPLCGGSPLSDKTMRIEKASDQLNLR